MQTYQVYVADAFADRLFGGNQAGVVLLREDQKFPDEAFMQMLAGELKHSETAFVKKEARDAFRIRYFTPEEEVALCGHATIGAFSVLYEEGQIADGRYRFYPGLQREPLQVEVSSGRIWMDMAAPKTLYTFSRSEAEELYLAYGIEPWETGPLPQIVNTGLSDIILPVKDRQTLLSARQDRDKVIELSHRYQVVGVHMFCREPGQDRTYCRNFGPAVGIDEESATGTANGALTWYLYEQGVIHPDTENVFLQGESMGKPSVIRSILVQDPDTGAWKIKIGGSAVIALKGELKRP